MNDGLQCLLSVPDPVYLDERLHESLLQGICWLPCIIHIYYRGYAGFRVSSTFITDDMLASVYRPGDMLASGYHPHLLQGIYWLQCIVHIYYRGYAGSRVSSTFITGDMLASVYRPHLLQGICMASVCRPHLLQGICWLPCVVHIYCRGSAGFPVSSTFIAGDMLACVCRPYLLQGICWLPCIIHI